MQAEYEELERLKTKETPLPSKYGREEQETPQNYRSAFKKMSAGRLLLNYEEANKHPIWSCDTQLGDRGPSTSATQWVVHAWS